MGMKKHLLRIVVGIGLVAGAAGWSTPHLEFPYDRTMTNQQRKAYAKQIDTMKKNGKLRKLTYDRDGDDKDDLILWYKDGELVMEESRKHLVPARVKLPSPSQYDRIVCSRDRTVYFVIQKPGQIRRYADIITTASREWGPVYRRYCRAGKMVTGRYWGGQAVHECTMGLFFMKGDKFAYGLSGHPGDSEFERRYTMEKHIVNPALGQRYKQDYDKAERKRNSRSAEQPPP